jgi:hypothetical protein
LSGGDSEEEIMDKNRVRELNDILRRTFVGGRIMMTIGVNALSDDEKTAVLNKVRSFDHSIRTMIRTASMTSEISNTTE